MYLISYNTGKYEIMPRQTFRTHDHHGNPHPPARLAFYAAQKRRDDITNRLRKACANPAFLSDAEYATLQAELLKLDAPRSDAPPKAR